MEVSIGGDLVGDASATGGAGHRRQRNPQNQRLRHDHWVGLMEIQEAIDEVRIAGDESAAMTAAAVHALTVMIAGNARVRTDAVLSGAGQAVRKLPAGPGRDTCCQNV